MPPAALEPAIPASERPQTHALDRADIGIALPVYWDIKIFSSIDERCPLDATIYLLL
jgi:hypothetical protein